MRRYRRQALYDYDLKAWKTYYTNNEGKIVFDSGKKTYKEIKLDIKKNINPRKSDISSKKNSLIITPSIKTKQSWQRQVDKILKKKRLTIKDKENLKLLSDIARYKQRQVKKRIKSYSKKIKPKYKNFLEKYIHATFHSTTSSHFYIADVSYNGRKNEKGLKELLKLSFKSNTRLEIEFESMSMQAELNDLIIDAIRFEDVMSNLISGYGKIPFQRGKYKIRFKEIKR